MRPHFLALALSLFAAGPLLERPAFADEEDWFSEEDDEDEEWERFDEADSEIDMDDDPEIIEGEEGAEDENEGGDILEDVVEEDVIGGEGVDNARSFRAAQTRAYDLGVEEELIFWEQYLERYPNTLFRVQIDERLDSLAEQLYSERIEDERDAVPLDAGMEEIRLASPIGLESIDPRNRIRAGFEWGFPDYMNLLVDYESQLRRDLSWHAGMRRRIAGWNFEGGLKYAFVKSKRTNTIVTAILDAHLNTGPAFLGLRPMMAFGKRFDVGSGNGLDLSLQAGADVELRASARTIYMGGFNLFYWASPTVGMFLESSFSMKGGPDEGFGNGRPFMFNLMTFGLRFQPGATQATYVALAANVPYANNYWGHHYGAVQGDLLYYLD